MRKWQQLALTALGLGAAMMLVALLLVGFEFRKLDVTEAVQRQARAMSCPVARTAEQSASDVVRAIDVTGGMQDVNVCTIDGTEITLEYTDSDLMHWEVERTGDGTLKMTLHSDIRWYDYVGMHFPDESSLTIGLPSDAALDALRLSTTSGNIDVSRLPQITELALSSTSGNVQLRGSSAGQIEISTTGGSVVAALPESAAAYGIRVETTSGDVHVPDGAHGDCPVSIQTTSGSVHVTCENNGK